MYFTSFVHTLPSDKRLEIRCHVQLPRYWFKNVSSAYFPFFFVPKDVFSLTRKRQLRDVRWCLVFYLLSVHLITICQVISWQALCCVSALLTAFSFLLCHFSFLQSNTNETWSTYLQLPLNSKLTRVARSRTLGAQWDIIVVIKAALVCLLSSVLAKPRRWRTTLKLKLTEAKIETRAARWGSSDINVWEDLSSLSHSLHKQTQIRFICSRTRHREPL